MKTNVSIRKANARAEGFALVDLLKNDRKRICRIDLQFSKFLPLPSFNARAVDFVVLASTVYCLDKLVSRKLAPDSWTRQFSIQLPVSDVCLWNNVSYALGECVSFLTGDAWEFRFVRQTSGAVRSEPRGTLPRPDTVCLFSGGLDSLIGAVDWLEQNQNGRILVVGHHDGKIAGPLADQKGTLRALSSAYPGRISSILVRVGHVLEKADEYEITLRSRSLLFLSLGIVAASAFGDAVPLLVPENGTIALNVPLTPSRRGSCSTRTVHPHFLNLLQTVLQGVGLGNRIVNPLKEKTKGEAISRCQNVPLLRRLAPLTTSCAKRGHKVHYTHRAAKACGRCMPCIYRRAGLNLIGEDTERYGDDICLGEIDIEKDEERANDLRACLVFLRKNLGTRDIASLLLANGSLDVTQLPRYAALIERAMNEIRKLLQDKANQDMKQIAGV